MRRVSTAGRSGSPRAPSRLRRVALAGGLGLLTAASLLPGGAAPRPAAAQPGGMPDLRAMSGRPLPVRDLRVGTVVVRVSRQIPMNGVAGIEVKATVSTPGGGEARLQTAKTAEDGRATFEGLLPGATFQAEATVDGERLQTSAFAIPAEGGARILLIAGLGAVPAGAAGSNAHGAESGGEAAAAAPEDDGSAFAMDAVAGSVAPKPGLPAGTLELAVLDKGGAPIVGREVKLGQVSGAGDDKNVKLHRAASDDKGIARFSGLSTGEGAAYAAVVLHEGMKLATQPFRMDPAAGMAGELRALDRTADASGLRIDNRSKVIFDLREDAVAVMQSLVFKNVSDKIFDAGENGLVVPLPKGFVGAQEIPGGVPLDVREGVGMVMKGTIAPSNAAAFATQIRFGYVLTANGDTEIELAQPLPFGMEAPLLLVPAAAHLELEAPGIKRLPDDQDAQGNKVKAWELPAVPPGGTLAVTISGISQRDKTGPQIAGALAVLLFAGALVAGQRPKREGDRARTLAALGEKREAHFAELVRLERKCAEAQRGEAGPLTPADEERRKELVAKLESIYREIAALEAEAVA